MRTNKILLVVIFSFYYFIANAQIFVGGNFSLNTTSDNSDNGTTKTKSSNFNIDFSPMAGKFLSEKIAVGVALDLSFSGMNSGVNNDLVERMSTIGINPFLRYYAVKWNKFSIFGQGNIGLAFSGSTVKSGNETSDGPKSTQVTLKVYPGLSYDINEKFSLETSLNFLNFGYVYTHSKSSTSTSNHSGLILGAGLSNIVWVGDITVGAIYKFSK